ncbi:4-diphosphocytidyl-2-C-methyl-D-erythritol kinase [Sphingomonas sp. EC-HK361]|uniref:4-(cytidine 5'-diphospho)-2-C-methyl-D-erythritol kinase n=1 Tax=Sphingomonas sp. EC-HK361 TaxID=2038397 RepID=UPI001256D512|nr:4-(cytidine 5'-diphospho)-2-C-methyl-D-erythritol kinase [Sphingomonas sp. EC-HK361]VVT03225.1 4-diphosphocytidyl-2-C-methyl-D-erythritol kinase [Sphingomonas sp. EC-HK361]
MIVETAPAKINLALHVRGRRPDGYHEIETLFAFCRDGDSVSVASAGQNSFAVTGPFAAALDGDGENLVIRAALAFAAVFAPATAHAIVLDKHLPVASGIGGGSADAAATLRALASLHGVPRAEPKFVDIAKSLGADVPACLAGVAALGRGRGDDLVAVEGLAGLPVLLVNPGAAVSTAQVFRAWDGIDRGALDWSGDPIAAAGRSRNDLERIARAIVPTIDAVIGVLSAASGARLVRMSGSGATCFAIFEDREQVAEAARVARSRGWWCLETALA